MSLLRSLSLGLALAVISIASSEAKTRFSKYNGVYINDQGVPVIPMIDDTGAGNTIDIEIYTIKDPGVMKALLASQKRGSRIRIIQEPAPFDTADPCDIFAAKSNGESAECRQRKDFRAKLLKGGALYVPFNTQELCPLDPPFTSCFQHGKIMIIDGKTVLMSSGNFDSSNFCTGAPGKRCNRDYTVVTENPHVLQYFTSIFELDLVGKRYDIMKAVDPRRTSKLLTIGPISRDPLIDFIRSAKRRIQIQNQYVTEFKLNDAIIDAARRGVEVQVNVSSVCAFDAPSEKTAKMVNAIYSKFDAAGVKSRMFTKRTTINGNPGYLHAKAIVVDDAVMWIGSVNGSQMALTQNREFGIFIAEPKSVKRISQQLEADFNDPNGESWKESLECAKDK